MKKNLRRLALVDSFHLGLMADDFLFYCCPFQIEIWDVHA